MYVCIYVPVHVRACVWCVSVYVSTCVHGVCVCGCVGVCVCVWVYMCMCVCTCVCVCVCVCVSVHVILKSRFEAILNARTALYVTTIHLT